VLAAEFQPDILFKSLLAERHVAVAVSGGSDSLALLLLAQDFLQGRNVALTALCFDHGLRAASAHEALWVKQFCNTRGIACEVLQWSGSKPLTGIQAAARTARYDVLTDKCRSIGACVLMTGHTADDQAETVLMRSHRTDSVLSLAGIWPQTEWGGVKILRPLLALKRGDLRKFLNAQQVQWLEDPSNSNEVFERVRVRNQLANDEGATPGLLKIAAQSQSQVQQALTAIADFSALFRKDAYGVVRFPLQDFLTLDRLSRHLALRRAFSLFGMGQKVLKDEADRLMAWLEMSSSKPRTLGGVVFMIKREQVVMEREVARIAPETIADASGQLLWDKRFMIPLEQGARIIPMGLANNPPFARPIGLSANGWRGMPCIIQPSGAMINGISEIGDTNKVDTLETGAEVPM
jgi:tRNA(Ile)-lysidine synthase